MDILIFIIGHAPIRIYSFIDFLKILAIAAHKFVMSFCVGLELYIAKTRFIIYAIYLLVFAIMSPIGIGIGIAITKMGDNETAYYICVAVLQALAGGTLLYVVAFEVLERERSKSVSGLVQLFFVILGFSVMTTVELLGIIPIHIKVHSVHTILYKMWPCSFQ